jgi:hypothetical protein
MIRQPIPKLSHCEHEDHLFPRQRQLLDSDWVSHVNGRCCPRSGLAGRWMGPLAPLLSGVEPRRSNVDTHWNCVERLASDARISTASILEQGSPERGNSALLCGMVRHPLARTRNRSSVNGSPARRRSRPGNAGIVHCACGRLTGRCSRRTHHPSSTDLNSLRCVRS